MKRLMGSIALGACLALTGFSCGQNCYGPGSGPGCPASTPKPPPPPPTPPPPLIAVPVPPGTWTLPVPIDLTTQLTSPPPGVLNGCGTAPGPVVPQPVKIGAHTIQLSAGGTVTDPTGVPGSNTSRYLEFTIGAAEKQPSANLPPTANQPIAATGSTDLTKAIAAAFTGLKLDNQTPFATVIGAVDLSAWYTYLNQTGRRSTAGTITFSLPNRCGIFVFNLQVDLK